MCGPDGEALRTVALSGIRVTVGRLPDVNDIALEPDPELLVTRAAHCTFVSEGSRWYIVDGGSVNGTFLRRGGALQRVRERTALLDGDVVCVLAELTDEGERRFFELAFRATTDSQATRAVPAGEALPSATEASPCLYYDSEQARLLLRQAGEEHEIRIRAQGHRLIRYMVERNTAIGGTPALCTHDELIEAVWANEPMHTRIELARLVWELRRSLAPFAAQHLIENERRRGYRLRTCPDR